VRVIVSMCACGWVGGRVGGWAGGSIYVCIHMHVCMCIYGYTYLCIYMYMHECACVRVCVSVLRVAGDVSVT